MKSLVIAFAIVLAACSGTAPPAAQLATACNSLATAYLTAAGYRAQGKLSAAQVKALTDLEPIAFSSCDKAHPPTDVTSALAAVVAAEQKIALTNAGVQ